MPGSNLSSLTNLLFTEVLLRQIPELFSLSRSPRPQRSHFPPTPIPPTHSLPPKYLLSSLRLNLRTFIHSCLGANALELFSLCRSPRPQRPHFPPTPIPPTHRLPPKYLLSPLRLNLRTFIHSCLDRISVRLQMDYCITGADAPMRWNSFLSADRRDRRDRTFIESCLDRVSVRLQMHYCMNGAAAPMRWNYFLSTHRRDRR